MMGVGADAAQLFIAPPLDSPPPARQSGPATEFFDETGYLPPVRRQAFRGFSAGPPPISNGASAPRLPFLAREALGVSFFPRAAVSQSQNQGQNQNQSQSASLQPRQGEAGGPKRPRPPTNAKNASRKRSGSAVNPNSSPPRAEAKRIRRTGPQLSVDPDAIVASKLLTSKPGHDGEEEALPPDSSAHSQHTHPKQTTKFEFAAPEFAEILFGDRLRRSSKNSSEFALDAAQERARQAGLAQLHNRAQKVAHSGRKRAFWLALQDAMFEQLHEFVSWPTIKFRHLDLFAVCSALERAASGLLVIPPGSDTDTWGNVLDTCCAHDWAGSKDVARHIRMQKLALIANAHAPALQAAWAAAQKVDPAVVAAGPFPSATPGHRMAVRCPCGHCHFEYTTEKPAQVAEAESHIDECESARGKGEVPVPCGFEDCRTCGYLPGANDARVRCLLCGMFQHVSCLIEENMLGVDEALALLSAGGVGRADAGLGACAVWVCDMCDDTLRQPSTSKEWSRRGLHMETLVGFTAERRIREGRACVDHWVFAPNTQCFGRNAKGAYRSISKAPSWQ
jgi:hypothetical protein